jgi:hypothetical protein
VEGLQGQVQGLIDVRTWSAVGDLA